MTKNRISIVFIDIIGLKYDGLTPNKMGLGGSESAIIYMAEELASLGHRVTVINNCVGPHSTPGIVNGVEYIDLSEERIWGNQAHDVFIASRTVVPFLEPRFSSLLRQARHKVLWMHDTFCGGDEHVESLVVNRQIDEIFTLSDFHTNYVTTSHHGPKRNFEVLKPHLWQTRNGVRLHGDDDHVYIEEKDPNLFVFNASVSKGMKPLLQHIWPRFVQVHQLAKLKIIGGYYNWEPEKEDAYEQEWKGLADGRYTNVEFTGIITQEKISEILRRASFFVYPGAFPETSGISTLEALAYGTPLITTRFGALEESAIDMACYKIDYAIEPNSLYPHINQDQQITKFLEQMSFAYQTRYLWQQKAYAALQVRDVVEWSTVAKQWQQHLFLKLGQYLPREDYREVMQINSRVQEIFNRQYTNKEDRVFPKKIERPIRIITPFWNGAGATIVKCIQSVLSQDYDEWHLYLIDDASTDDTQEIIKNYLATLANQNDRARITYTRNKINKGAPRNHFDALGGIYGTLDDALVMLLDGDDWLANNPNIFNFYNNHADQYDFFYGSCWSVVDNIPLIAQEYSPATKALRKYRQQKFTWGIPYPHTRVFNISLCKELAPTHLQDDSGNWFKAGGDGALFYFLLDACEPDRVKCVKDIFYHYNDASPFNDYKINGEEQTRNAELIAPKKEMLIDLDNHRATLEKAANEFLPKKRILIAIPTAKYIEPETFKSIYNLEVPEGYSTQFQYFYGYNVEQIRNLIADWVVKGFDYLLAVDGDMAFPPDTLKRLLSHKKDYVSAVYIQRKLEAPIPEIYQQNGYGGVEHMHINDVVGQTDLIQIAASGFGCVLITKQVFEKIGYPQFRYHTALDHKDTVSEDVYFCAKARENGFFLWCDPTIICDHIGSFTFKPFVQKIEKPAPAAEVITDVQSHLKWLQNAISIPTSHSEYLGLMSQDYTPKIIYDIGSCVLHWSKHAKNIWPKAEIYCVEAMAEAVPLHIEAKEQGLIKDFAVRVLGEEDGEKVDFWTNPMAPGGNSMFRENPKFSDKADEFYNDSTRTKALTQKLSTLLSQKGWPMPNLIKIDTQGSELPILKGLGKFLRHVEFVILELPKREVEYNLGAPTADETVAWMESQGFKVLDPMFSDNGFDADWLFVNTFKIVKKSS